ncbi:hypothetical protein [Acidithiobacillus sp.]|uniref:hypothetical protein n=1 Tax=Acidithiobacillus sp. TaxID=1872118 RepID=UPI00258F0AE4|nr:hypothetical protein [Acidithiobacillus sp.]MDD5375743.1 hypothetical protein [Acidithiobacillus sp.]
MWLAMAWQDCAAFRKPKFAAKIRNMSDREYDDCRTASQRMHASPHSPPRDEVVCAYCGARLEHGIMGVLKTDDGYPVYLNFCNEAHFKQYKAETQNE